MMKNFMNDETFFYTYRILMTIFRLETKYSVGRYMSSNAPRTLLYNFFCSKSLKFLDLRQLSPPPGSLRVR